MITVMTLYFLFANGDFKMEYYTLQNWTVDQCIEQVKPVSDALHFAKYPESIKALGFCSKVTKTEWPTPQP